MPCLPGNDSDPDIFSGDTFSPALAGPSSSPQNPVITDFASNASDNWSEATPSPTSPKVQSSCNFHTSYPQGGANVCIPLQIHDRPFIIPSTVPLSQYAATLPPFQFCHFKSISAAEMCLSGWKFRDLQCLFVKATCLYLHTGMPKPFCCLCHH
jgi:hypothetical protein